jgi:hypothetical protein
LERVDDAVRTRRLFALIAKRSQAMDRFYLAIIVSAFLVLVAAAGLLVTRTHIVARNRTAGRSLSTVRIGNKLPVFGKTFPSPSA